MNQPILSKSDINNLYQIVDEANKGYLKQSHLSDKPNFNILRVLATLRLLYHQSPPALYNAVLFITKNYNPQTYYHWKKAIEDLSKNRNALFKSKSNYCRPEMNTYTKTYQNSFNRSRINESQHLQSKSYAQINIQQEMNSSKQQIFEDEDQKDVSQTNAETGKRQFYTKADSISHISKNHYISFEPYRHSIDNYRNHYYEKENINSTNVEESRRRQSSYQYIEAIQRDLNLTAKNSQAKTPIDQSFIKNITNSESPFLFTKMHQEIIDPIQQQMNARAHTFRNFNLKLKVFSSLQANSYVFMKAKENELKAKLQYNSKLLLNSFISLRQNIKISKQAKLKEQRANNFNKNKLLGKVFNVLKLFFDLRKNAEAIKTPNVSNYNKMNFQFVLNLLFALNCQNQDQKMNFLNFQSKIMELIHSNQTDKIYLIVKYFGKHSWATEENIQNLINLYKLRITRQAFKFMRLSSQKNKNYLQIRQVNLKKQSFYALKIRWNRYVCYRNKIKTAQNKRNRILLEKVMKSMLSTVYSTKLYSKRCEYIERKHLFHLKTKTYKMWLDKVKDSLLIKVKMNQKVNKAIQKITCFIKKMVLKGIKNENLLIQQKIKIVCDKILELKKVEIFRKLKRMHTQIFKIRQSQQLMQKYRFLMALSTWKQNTNKGKAISRMINIIKSYYFRKLLLPNLQESIQIIRSIHFTQQDTINRTFKIIKYYAMEQKRIRLNLIEAVKNKIYYMRKIIGFSSVKINFNIQKQEKQIRILNFKEQNIITQRIFSKKQNFINHFKDLYNQKLQMKKLQDNLTLKLNLFRFSNFLSKLKNMALVKANSQKLKARILYNKSRSCADNILNMIQSSKIETIQTIRKKTASHSLSMTLLKIYDQERKRRQISDQFRKTQLYKKSFQSLYLIINQSHQVSKIANQINQNKTRYFIKTSIIFWRKINKISRIHRKYVIKRAFSNQSNQKSLKSKIKQYVDWKIIKVHQQLITKLQSSKKFKKQQTKIQQNTQLFKKWLGIARFTQFYMKKLIATKHLYMALKFRALKLCSNSFKTLASKQPRKTQMGMIYKGLAQRLSTDINE